MLTHTEFVVGPSGMFTAIRTGLDVGKGVFVSATLGGAPVSDLTEVIEYAVNL